MTIKTFWIVVLKMLGFLLVLLFVPKIFLHFMRVYLDTQIIGKGQYIAHIKIVLHLLRLAVYGSLSFP